LMHVTPVLIFEARLIGTIFIANDTNFTHTQIVFLQKP